MKKARYSFLKTVKALGLGLIGAIAGGGGGALAEPLSQRIAEPFHQVVAQNILPDSSLGEEASVVQVSDDATRDLITGGAARGQNLFHSFEDFSIIDRSAYFVIDPSIEHIFSRVTGPDISQIQNTLGTLETSDGGLIKTDASLYLMNPNGVIFSESGGLDTNGSFVVTTAEEIVFSDQGSFSSAAQNVPSFLLSVDPSAYFFGEQSPGDIISRSRAFNANNAGFFSGVGLGVADGETISLIGGNVSILGTDFINNSGIVTQGGNINAVAIAGEGRIQIEEMGQLTLPPDLSRARITINESTITTGFGDGGSINLIGDEVAIDNGTFSNRIIQGTGVPNATDKNITIDATAGVSINNSFIQNGVLLNATGEVGSLIISADSLSVDSSFLVGSLEGFGSGGNIIINVDNNVSFDNASFIVSNVASGAVGNGSDIEINAGSLSLQNGSNFASLSQGTGNTGNVQLNIIGETLLENGSVVSSITDLSAVGNSSNVTILTGSLSLQGGSFITSGKSETGQAGNILVEALDDVVLDNFSGISTSVGIGADGDLGNITVRSGELSLLNGSQIDSATSGDGSSGNIIIETNGLALFDNLGSLNSTTLLGSNVASSGNISVAAGELQILNGARFSSSVQGTGSAGDILIDTRGLTVVDGATVLSVVAPNARGNGGDIKIESGSVRFSNNAGIASSSFGFGNSGRIRIVAVDSAEFGSDTGVLSSTALTTIGNGGDVLISADSIAISGNARIASSSAGQGSPGNITINRAERLSVINGEISTTAERSSGGDISIQADQVQLEGDSDILSRTFNRTGNGGNVTIQANDFIIALGDSDIVASASEGRGGDVTLATPAFLGENFSLATLGDNPDTVDGNERVDINATGNTSGIVTVPDVSFLENDLAILPAALTAPDQLIAGSCIARSAEGQGVLQETGSDGGVSSPQSVLAPSLSTGTVQTIPTSTAAELSSQKIVFAIEEPTGVYELADGRLVIGQSCS